MKFYTVSTFRNTLESLMQKPRDGYTSVVGDICKMLQKMPDNILRDTNDRVKLFPQFRIVKLRIANSGQHLPKTDGFRLIYFVSLVSDEVVLLRVYPKRGPQKTIDLVESEYTRLEYELLNESEAHTLHQVDINNLLAEISTDDTLQGGS